MDERVAVGIGCSIRCSMDVNGKRGLPVFALSVVECTLAGGGVAVAYVSMASVSAMF